MLEFQATRQLPFLKEDIITGYKLLEAEADGYSNVALVIVQKNIINNYMGFLKSAGLSYGSICLSTEAVSNWFFYNVIQDEKDSPDFYILIDIDYQFTELLICQGQRIVFSRAFAHGAKALHDLGTEIEITHWIKILGDHMHHTLRAFKREKAFIEEGTKKIFVSGGVSKFFSQINKYLYTEFAVPIKYVNALEVLKSEKNAKLPVDLVDMPISFSSVIGMVTKAESLKIDILPKEIKEGRLNKERQSLFVKICFLAAAIAGLIFILTGARFYYKLAYIDYLDRQILQLGPHVNKVELAIEKTNVLKKQSDIKASPVELLREIYRIMPAGANLSNLSFQDGKTIMLRGAAGTMSAVFELAPSLEKSKYFKNVKVVSTSKRKTTSGEVVDFQINCLLR